MKVKVKTILNDKSLNKDEILQEIMKLGVSPQVLLEILDELKKEMRECVALKAYKTICKEARIHKKTDIEFLDELKKESRKRIREVKWLYASNYLIVGLAAFNLVRGYYAYFLVKVLGICTLLLAAYNQYNFNKRDYEVNNFHKILLDVEELLPKLRQLAIEDSYQEE